MRSLSAAEQPDLAKISRTNSLSATAPMVTIAGYVLSLGPTAREGRSTINEAGGQVMGANGASSGQGGRGWSCGGGVSHNHHARRQHGVDAPSAPTWGWGPCRGPRAKTQVAAQTQTTEPPTPSRRQGQEVGLVYTHALVLSPDAARACGSQEKPSPVIGSPGLVRGGVPLSPKLGGTSRAHIG